MFYTYSFITTKQESIADVQKRKKRSQSIALQEIIISQRKRPREKERNKISSFPFSAGQAKEGRKEKKRCGV